MNNQDPIADMLTRIRNANRVGRRLVLVPASKICSGIAQVLKDEGYIEEFDKVLAALESERPAGAGDRPTALSPDQRRCPARGAEPGNGRPPLRTD